LASGAGGAAGAIAWGGAPQRGAQPQESDSLRIIKSGSSKWVHESIGLRSFQWQVGYGAFTVRSSDIEVIRKYIRNQREHHRKKTFQEEYIELLNENGIEFDEKYLW
jgi:putative transposase